MIYLYEEYLDKEGETVHDIVGFPSGQMIEVYESELKILKKKNLIRWSGSEVGYGFLDDDYNKVMEILYKSF